MKRKDIIEALKKAGIKFDVKMTNVDLELLLKTSGQPGATPTAPPPPPAEPSKKNDDGQYEATMLTSVWYNRVLHKKGERVTLDEGAYELFKKEKFIA